MEIKSYSRFLKADEDIKLGHSETYTITDVTHEEMGQAEDGGKEKKYVVAFAETDRCLALNTTNLNACLAKFGNQSEKWKGQKLTLRADKVQFGAKMVPGLRVVG